MSFNIIEKIKEIIKGNNILSEFSSRTIYLLNLKFRKKKYSVLDFYHVNPFLETVYVSPKSKEISYAPQYVEGGGYANESCDLPEVRVFKIDNGTVIGNSNIIIVSTNTAFYNHVTGENINYTDGALIDYHKHYEINKNRYIYRSKMHGVEVDRAISFCINYSFNYYHYVLECLSKFQMLDKCGLPHDIPIIIDSKVRDIIQFRELLKIFNKYNRELVYLDRLQFAEVRELYAVSPIHRIPANFVDINSITASSNVFNFDGLGYLRQTVLNRIKSLDGGSKRIPIYISRHDNPNRSYNNDEIEAYLASKGFTIIHPEKMSFLRQVSVFHSASVIVAASGAALTNIIFCQPDTKILTFSNISLDITIFSNLAACFNLKMRYMTGVDSDGSGLHSSFHIDLERMSKVIEQFMSNG